MLVSPRSRNRVAAAFASVLLGGTSVAGAVTVAGFTTLASGCSSSSDTTPGSPTGDAGGDPGTADAGCQAYVAPPSTDLTSPVSFATDIVAPIFSKTCAFQSCHGGMNNNHGVYLAADASAIHDSLVNVAAMDAPSLMLVVAGDPASSFLMHKVDGDQCTLSAKCTGLDCGTSMPQASADLGAPLLAVTQRDTIRRWIAQGAPNN